MGMTHQAFWGLLGSCVIAVSLQQFPLLVLSPQTSASRNEFWVVWPSISL